jgi:Fibronectin type III domain
MRLIAVIALVTISAVTPAAASIAPKKPGKVRVDRAAPTTLKLRWKDRARNETSYKVRAREQGASEWKAKRLRRNKTKFKSRGLEPGTVHEHQVRACGRGGCSGWSPVRRQATLLAPFGPRTRTSGAAGSSQPPICPRWERA